MVSPWHSHRPRPPSQTITPEKNHSKKSPHLFTAAFARADVSVLVPFEYTSLLWATIIGYLVWRDIPSTEVWIGAAIIIACGLYVIHRESLHHRSHRSERKVGEP
jgi:putative Mn2+ efflux pump MntP